MAFFSGMSPGGGMGMGGMGGSPSAFTSPGMDPMMLALLLRMQNGGIGGPGGGGMGAAPQLPQPPAMGGAMAPPMAPPPAGAPGPQQGGGLLQMLQGIDPAKLKSIFGMLGMGGGGGLPGAGAGGVPGAGTGGLY